MSAAGGVPPELSGREQWVCWRNECRDCGKVLDPLIKVHEECDEKTTKRPIDPSTGRFARTDDPETWGSLEEAAARFEFSDCHGVGFVFSEDDELAGVDLDDCRDPETGEIADWALAIIKQLNSYSEVSPSGTGVHVIVYGQLPERGSRKGGIEMYDEGRYFTVTGDRIPQSPSSVNYRQEQLGAVHEGHIQSDGDTEIVDFTIESFDPDVPETFTSDLGESLEEVRDRDGKLDELLTTIDPAGYESTSEADFAAAGKLWFWRFDRQDIARIIRLYRTRPKVIERDDYLELTISKAATGQQYDPRPQSFDRDVHILSDQTHYPSINETRFPEHKHFVLDKPPREGGSHASIKHLVGRPLVVLVSRHAIGEHHLGILDDVMPERCCAVHLVGSRIACENSDKAECPNLTKSFEQRYQLEHEAMDIVYRKRTVTRHDCPDGYCPHEFLKMCEKHAHAVVTVPQLLGRLERDFSENNLLIDEEQALSFFRPQSTELVEVLQMYEPDGTKRIQVASSNIGTQYRALKRIKERVFGDQQERKEIADREGRNWSRTSWEIDIVNAVEYLEVVKDELGVTDVSQEMAANGENVTVKSVLDELRGRLGEIDRPEPHTDPDRFRDKLADYVARYYHDDTINPGAMIEATLYPYHDRPFDYKRTGRAHTLRMIGGRQLFHADDLRSFNQIGIIAGPEGEMLFDDLSVDAETIIIDQFRYEETFVIVPMAREKDGKLESPAKQRRRAARVSKLLNRRGHPHIAITGTKERAEDHHTDLDAGLSNVIGNPSSPAKDIYATWSGGETAIIYENSVVSRGIDAPPFDISVVVSSGFATPYWESRAAYYHDKDEDEYLRSSAIVQELKSRELTNAVLRPAPTPNIEDHYGTKFIVVPDWDAARIKYLSDRRIPRIANPKSAANFVQQLTVGGAFRITVDNIHDEVDGDDRAFLEIVTEAELKEKKHTRPSCTLDELTEWREERHLTGRNRLEMILKAVPVTGDPATVTEIHNILPTWSFGRINASLEVLERKGLVESYKISDDPPRWGWKHGY